MFEERQGKRLGERFGGRLVEREVRGWVRGFMRVWLRSERFGERLNVSVVEKLMWPKSLRVQVSSRGSFFLSLFQPQQRVIIIPSGLLHKI